MSDVSTVSQESEGEQPKSYTLDDILVTADGYTGTLQQWQGTGYEAKTTAVTDLDGTTNFEFDDPTGRPENVIVYTNGRPPPLSQTEEEQPVIEQRRPPAFTQNGSNP
jgi:hypothetical protein